MKIGSWRFNSFLVLMTFIAVCGCKTAEEREEAKEESSIRFHLEVNRDGTDDNESVPIYRKKPVMINVTKEPFLDERDVMQASVIETLGGFSIKIQFDDHGTRALEVMTTSYRGRRIGIFSMFEESRWLAAPAMTRSIVDGVLVFTPDATKEEAERIVLGLNNVAEDLRSQSWLKD